MVDSGDKQPCVALLGPACFMLSAHRHFSVIVFV
jgi:hypothetical protein